MALETAPIDDYCTAHSTPLSNVCRDLEKFTRKNVPMSVMLVGPLEGSFLGFLVGLVGARRVLEVGCYTGYSALSMAERLPEGGELVTIDYDEKTTRVAKDFWARSPYGKKISLRLGKALDILPELRGPFDLVFLDATKSEYLEYVRLTLPMLNTRGVIVADNCLRDGEVLKVEPEDASVRATQAFNRWVCQDPNLECMLLPLRDGVMLIRKRVPATRQ